MAKKTRIKVPVASMPKVPKDLKEAADILLEISKEKRAIEEIQSKLNETADQLKLKASRDAETHQDKIFQLMSGLFAFAEANHDKLTEEGKRKTVETMNGNFGWRTTPPAVNISNTEKAIKSLESLGLDHFIRIKKEVNKEEILKNPEKAEKIKGISITQREEFFVKPTEIRIEISKKVNDLKKAIS